MISERSTKAYCCDDISRIENYDKAMADNTQTWHCHHRLEIQGKFTNSPELLKKCGLYYNVPAWQLIFLTKADHKRLHTLGNTYMRGKPLSDEAKQKIREANLGKHHSDAAKQKMSKSRLGQLWWNNGAVCKRSRECPGPEWKRGRL